MALQYWCSQITGSCVEVHCDNSAAVFTLTYFKAASPYLCQVARNIWSLLVRHNITLHVKHIPGRFNVMADKLSRLKSSNDMAQFKLEHPDTSARTLFAHWCTLNNDI